MSGSLSKQQIVDLANSLTAQIGLSYSGDRLLDLEKQLDDIADALGFEDVDPFYDWVMNNELDQEDCEILAEFLTVGETYFFRDPKAFAVLENEILPKLINAKKEGARFFRIWSAGCCTGEEPYSVAISLSRLIPDIENWQIKIIGTDINSSFLEKAEQGVYSEWSFRSTDKATREQFFRRVKPGNFEVVPSIKKMVQFEWMNLAEFEASAKPDYSCMDIIFCRNVFIYFDHKTIQQTMKQLTECLISDGYLFVGPNELPLSQISSLSSIQRPGAILLSKTSAMTLENSENQNKNQVDQNTGSGLVSNRHKSVPGEQFTDSADLREDDKNPDVTAFEEAALAYADYQYRKAATLLELRCSHTQDYPAMTLLAKCYANLGELDKAHLWCERAIRANKLNPNTYYLLATVLHEKGIEHLAINALKQAITLNSKFVLAEFTLGNLLKQRGDRAGAEQLFRATLKLLEEYNDDDIIPESGGTTANGLKVIVTSILSEFVRTK